MTSVGEGVAESGGDETTHPHDAKSGGDTGVGSPAAALLRPEQTKPGRRGCVEWAGFV